MTNHTEARPACLLIAVAAALVAGRIMATNFMYDPAAFRDVNDPEDTRRLWPSARPQPVPTFSSNDRSRWATIRALVDEGTYQIGKREYLDADRKKYRDSGIIFADGWGSVDKVMDPATGIFYSSKPTLFPTLLAGEYWLLKHGLGWEMATHLRSIVRVVLLTVNWLPLILYWVLLARLIDRFGTTDWGKLYVMGAACFGTFLTTFAITLNNHTVAACFALYALYCALDIWTTPAGDAPPWSQFVLAGFCAAFTAAVELPALAFLVGVFALLLWRAPRQTLLGFAPPVVVVAAAWFLTNYLAIGKLTPAYSELGAKSEWYLYEGSHWLDAPGKGGIDYAWKKEGRLTYVFHFLLGHHGIFLLSPIFLLSMAGLWSGGRALWASGGRDEASGGRQPPVGEASGGRQPSVGEASGGRQPPVGEASGGRQPSVGEASGGRQPPVGEASGGRQPPVGEASGGRQPPVGDGDSDSTIPTGGLRPPLAEDPWFFLVSLTAYLTVVVVGFYLVNTNNYGGNTCGPRWVFWLTPFWLLVMLPVVDRLAVTKRGRGVALLCLAVSVASAGYPVWNPWRQPWIYNLMEAYGMIPY